ncbi:MAG: hypothetical protein JW912_02435 [Sedimentisphaerales bacterium]|nr:hypothetical protein [Sedimentisphaerales bacterium]
MKKQIGLFNVAAIWLAAVFFGVCPVYGYDYYVSPTGNDNYGGTINYPFATIDFADLDCLIANWLLSNCGECGGADFDGTANVDLGDFQRLAENWLREGL